MGGYAESQILLQHLNDEFGRHCGVLCPFRPQDAVVKGAVVFGRNPDVVTSRKSAFTYGFDICETFDESKHRADGRELCDDIFKKLVEIDKDVGWEETRVVNSGTGLPGLPHPGVQTLSLRSASERLVVAGWWNDLVVSVHSAASVSTFKKSAENRTLQNLKKKKCFVNIMINNETYVNVFVSSEMF